MFTEAIAEVHRGHLHIHPCEVADHFSHCRRQKLVLGMCFKMLAKFAKSSWTSTKKSAVLDVLVLTDFLRAWYLPRQGSDFGADLQLATNALDPNPKNVVLVVCSSFNKVLEGLCMSASKMAMNGGLSKRSRTTAATSPELKDDHCMHI